MTEADEVVPIDRARPLARSIVAHTARAYGMTTETLMRGQGRSQCIARWCAMAILKDFMPGLADTDVAVLFGYSAPSVKNVIAKHRRRVEGCTLTRDRERVVRNGLIGSAQLRTEADVVAAMGL